MRVVLVALALAACGRVGFDPLATSVTIDAAPTIDAFAVPTRVAYVKASNTEAGDQFGHSVAVSGDGSTIAVGAPLESSNARGVNGTETNNLAPQSGAAYVFVRSGATWVQQAYLKSSNSDMGDQFGWRMDLSADGNTLVVAARHEDSASPNIPGDNNAQSAGAVYVFTRAGSVWTQQAYVKPINGIGAFDEFGSDVSLSDAGDDLVVGAAFEDSSTTGVNSTPNEAAMDAGAAYVLHRTGTSWGQVAYLKPLNTDAGDGFGTAVAMAGATLTVAVSSLNESSNATGFNGVETDNSKGGAGAVYIFRGMPSWSQIQYVKPANTDMGDGFGYSVSIDATATRLVVGAIDEASNARGPNGDGANNSAPSSGAAYVFRLDLAQQEQYIKPPNTDPGDKFGWEVAIARNSTGGVNGAIGEASNADGLGGTNADNSAPRAGAAFGYVTTGPPAGSYFKATNSEMDDNFGWAARISADGAVVVIGAPLEDGGATGIDGVDDNAAMDAGAAYVYF